jgi:hypothetical protein
MKKQMKGAEQKAEQALHGFVCGTVDFITAGAG